MHNCERVEACAEIVHHDAGAFGEPLQPANWKRLQNIEDTEKYKAHEKCFPSERDGDERDELSGDFVDDDKLRVFFAVGTRNTSGRGNADERDRCSGDDRR